jgi:hypothetical protein
MVLSLYKVFTARSRPDVFRGPSYLSANTKFGIKTQVELLTFIVTSYSWLITTDYYDDDTYSYS